MAERLRHRTTRLPKRPFKLWQKLELAGLAMILASVFIQFFFVLNIQDRMKSADDYANEMRLHHIYIAVTSGERLSSAQILV